MELLRLFFASLLLLPASAVSNGNLPVCSVDMAIGRGTNIMRWVNPPVDGAQWYSISTAPSVTTYHPGGLTPITITVKNLDLIYIGLLLVAEGRVNGTVTNVGQWTVLDGDDFFLPAACKFAAVVHKTADLKPLKQTFFWKGGVGMGTVSFRALIKQGEQNHGSFYKVSDTLFLTEGTPIPPQTVWKSEKGVSCHETCARQNMACDQTETLAMNNAGLLQSKIKDYYPCRLPLLKTCAPPATGANGYCYYTNCSASKTFSPASTCSRKSSDPIMNQQFCSCKAGGLVRDPVAPVLNPASTLGLRLPAPLELDAELTLNALDIRDGIVTIDLTGPQDRWFAIGWDTYSMDNAYATVVWLNDPTIRPPQDYFDIGDLGYQDGYEGWYDLHCQQALNDYCRFIGDKTPVTGVNWFACAVANSTNQYTDAYSPSNPNTYNATLSSRVPCKNGRASPYLPMTVGEYKLNFNPRGFTTLPQTVQVERTLVENGQFRIVFSRNASGPHPFPNRTSMPIIWSLGVQQFFGVPRGQSTPIKHMKKSETSVTVNLVPIYPVCLSPAPSTLPSLLVLLLSALFAGFSSNNNNKNVVMGVMLLALFVRPGSAHNWVNVPSRAQIAAVTVPCQQRVDPAPHLQVAPGQTFQLEWSTGHGETPTAWTYWVFLKEEDFSRLVDITDSNLEDYLDKAPPASVLTGDQWIRRHLAPLSHDTPGCVNCNNYSQFPAIFQSVLKPGNARFIERNAIAVEKSLQWWHEDVQQYWYPDSETNGDKRAQYKSAKYPWIISVHKFHVPNHWPDEYDMATFTFPNMGAGNYIAHFKWGGYRDCTDVHLMTNVPKVENPWGLVESANLSSTFARLDHCEFTYVLNPSTRCRVMTDTNASQCLADCLELDGAFGCTGVQAVLRQNPEGTLPYTENFPTKLYTWISANGVFPPPEFGPCDSRTIHKRASCGDLNPMCTAADVGSDPSKYICYGLTPYRDQDFQVEEDYVITTDPADPGFYSTCWVRLAPGGFLPSPPPVKPKPVWRVGEQCLSCDWLAEQYPTFPLNSAIPWKDALTTDCRDCDTEAASGCKPDRSFVDGGSVGSCASQTADGEECSATCDAGFQLFGAARQCQNGILTGAEQTCTFSGC